MILRQTVFIIIASFLLACTGQETSKNEFEGEMLEFNELAGRWDEAMPLGNAMLGSLVWQKAGKLRFSLDRADLWDLRPQENLDFEQMDFNDVYDHWEAKTYSEVQKKYDNPYNTSAAPSKIPAGALEFDIEQLGEVESVRLDIERAICIVEWKNGARLSTFVQADSPAGWYKFENIDSDLGISLIPPAYGVENSGRNMLGKLGYEQGEVISGENSITYDQQGWGDFSYQINTSWERSRNSLTGCWSISSSKPGWEEQASAVDLVNEVMDMGYKNSYTSHIAWWSDYWSRSSVSLPDTLLQKQYYLEMYKFGSAARPDAPPISLQAVWTADNGQLPPWKGDFHHDLNTQLSYWPAYAGNYLELEEGFLNWLWKYRNTFKKYTKEYFGVEGLNVPGVTTLEGEPMGGWIQYAFGQGVSAWLGHHFYLHWKFSGDREFLEQRAYPWIKDVAIFLDEISQKADNGTRKLRISSSPEIRNNSRDAWFPETTNFDLALVRFTYLKAAEMADELGLDAEASKWRDILAEWPKYAVDSVSGLSFAPGAPYNTSHRHFSHLLAYHPLGLIDMSMGENEQETIENTLKQLETMGTKAWTGYSFSWLGNLYARAYKGDKAVQALRTFAECFCLKSSFHANGDQCKAGHSNFTYRPFTLEGNFAFASGIQEMLIQSHTGTIMLFPAIPGDWKDVSFKDLRTYGAFVVSSEMRDGMVSYVKVVAENDGTFLLEHPFDERSFDSSKDYTLKENQMVFTLEKGEILELILKD